MVTGDGGESKLWNKIIWSLNADSPSEMYDNAVAAHA